MAMSRSEITAKLADVMRLTMPDVHFDGSEMREDMHLVGDLGLSSVGVLYVVIAIEEFFNIRFGDVGFADFRTLGDVISYIEEQVNG